MLALNLTTITYENSMNTSIYPLQPAVFARTALKLRHKKNGIFLVIMLMD